MNKINNRLFTLPLVSSTTHILPLLWEEWQTFLSMKFLIPIFSQKNLPKYQRKNFKKLTKAELTQKDLKEILIRFTCVWCSIRRKVALNAKELWFRLARKVSLYTFPCSNWWRKLCGMRWKFGRSIVTTKIRLWFVFTMIRRMLERM